MTPTYKHRNYDIEFDVGAEEWKCGALALADKSLAKLKTAIDREGKKRRSVNVKVYHMDEGYSRRLGGRYVYTVREATITLILENDRKACIKTAGQRGTEQVEIQNLYSLDQKKALDAFIAAKERESRAQQEASDLQDRLEAMTAAAIREAAARKADEAA